MWLTSSAEKVGVLTWNLVVGPFTAAWVIIVLDFQQGGGAPAPFCINKWGRVPRIPLSYVHGYM